MSTPNAKLSFEAPALADATDDIPRAKRRKVRKGTRSCWECRRRKMKCIFGSPTDAICVSCQRRGAKCVGQEFPEEVSASLDRNLQMGDRIVKLEALVEHLLKKFPDGSDPLSGFTTGQDDRNSRHSIHTPVSIGPEFSKFLASYDPSVENETAEYELLDGGTGLETFRPNVGRPFGQTRHERLSRALHESLPSPEETESIVKARRNISTQFYQMLTVPYTDLGQREPRSSELLFERPGSDAHPVLIARHMLRIVTFLQHLHPDFHQEMSGLSGSPREIMKRLADTAIGFITTNDNLVGNIEGLECIIMESFYQLNGGNLRKGLMAIRRAMIIAQLLGCHRPQSRAQCKVLDRQTRVYPQFIWFRLVLTERQLCLMLGLPQSTLDHNMASEVALAADTPMGRLERIHCVISSRILERNQSNPSSNEFSLAQELDKELQEAAKGLPAKWWLAPNLATVAHKPETLFWDMRRLFHQICHYNLLNQLHLPYMLRSSSSTVRKYDSSRITCVNAAREVLSRFIAYQSFNRGAFCCRIIDFFSLMAAMTLLLVHLDGHRHRTASLARSQLQGPQTTESENVLGHQRPADRAMMEQVQESMEEVSRLNADTLSAQSANILRRLLAIEADAAEGRAHSATKNMGVQASGVVGVLDETLGGDVSDAVHVYIPYFGTIKIAREGVVTRESLKPQLSAKDTSQSETEAVRTSGKAGADRTRGRSATCSSEFDSPSGTSQAEGIALANKRYNDTKGVWTEAGPCTRCLSSQSAVLEDSSVAAQGALRSPSDVPDALLQQYEHPSPTAEVDDWAFQGVDMAFFDSLMRGIGDDGNDDA